ncbi:MAG: hypothetical protein IJV64_12755, partial [Oscillospiraceae bacterium]|nr:hypothetical protein [Oscillospiraceae bacterium]
DSVGEQAVSLAMACWLGGYTEGDAQPELLLWDAAGWYAALLYRAEGTDLVSPGRVAEFLESLGWSGVLTIPQTWEEYGIVRRLQGADGSQSLDFVQHKEFADEMLGVNTEVAVKTLDADTVEAVLTYHFDGQSAASWIYEFDFEPSDSTGPFVYRLTGIRSRDEGPEMDPALPFTWEQLQTANRVDNVLDVYPAVNIRTDADAGQDDGVWLFRRANAVASLTGTWGLYRGCAFHLAETEDGLIRPVIDRFDRSEDGAKRGNDYLSAYLSGVCVMTLDRMEDDLVWAVCTFRSGFQENMAFDKGTLVLREVNFSYGDDMDIPPSVTRFTYGEKAPDAAYLDSWDGPMRTVTLVWESFEGGERHVRTEFVQTPADWEYIPEESVGEDYTVYMNRGYTQGYAYPGDGVDYTLYLTTAKG